jgi:protein involved in polysaccharide export with SLBB domain
LRIKQRNLKARIANGTYPIDGEGYVFLPITGRVKISTMNEEQFIQYLNSSFTQYFRIPNIQIRRLIRISLLGGFNKPGLYYVDSNEALWYVIQLVGGTVDGKSLSELTWERNNEILNENLIPLLESGKSLHELGFKSGDQIWVERPDEPDILDKAVQIGTLLTATATLITIYLTFYTR